MKDRLVVLARYPEPGKVKTRLIPALGAEGAAALYRSMAEYTMQTARNLAEKGKISQQVCFCGGNQAAMRSWLGPGAGYFPQVQGDLGERMAAVFQEAFAGDAQRVVIVGTDCPGLSEKIIQQAFTALETAEIVLGPADDGGYYLVGLAVEEPRLFAGIYWGTDVVFEQTMAIVGQLGLSCFKLETLADVDRPEDLALFTTENRVRFLGN